MPEIKKDRPAYVRFERRPIEDRGATMARGHYVAKDVDFAIVTPFGSADQLVQQADEWFARMKQMVTEERIPIEYLESYERAYERFLKGEEAPLEGTPIKDWPVLSPAQRTNMIAIGIRTVEDLAMVNQEAMNRIGLGAQMLKDKAANWLAAANDVGKVSERLSALEIDRARDQTQIKLLEETIRLLKGQLAETKVPA